MGGPKTAARRGQPAMPCVCLPILTCRGIASDLVAGEDPAGSLIAEAPAQYRPRHPEQTEFYQLFEDHFDSYVRGYEERFEPRAGPLRPVVVRSVEEFLSCGRLQGGFARIRCPKCHAEHLLAFSCRTSGFTSSATSPIPEATASASTARIPTGAESSARASKPTAPAPALPRPRPGTIPISRARPAALGPA